MERAPSQAGSRSTPLAHGVAEQNASLTEELAATKRRLADQQAITAMLRKALAELSLELQHAHEELAELSGVTRLPVASEMPTQP